MKEEILPGIRAFWTGCHHRSSIAYSINTSSGSVIVSDCFFKYRNVEEKVPLGIMESLDECMSAYARIRAEADHLLPLYDPLVPDHLKHVLSPR